MMLKPAEKRKNLFGLGVLLVIGCQVFSSGCSCEEEKKTALTEISLPPLELQGTPQSVQAEVYPLLGSTKASPVVLVLAEDPLYCSQTRQKFAELAHVLCSLPSSDGAAQPDAEAKLRAALVFLKKQYSRYLDSSPVLFVAGPPYGDAAFKMMLAEPGFFAHAYLAGFDSGALTNTLLAALHSKGAKTLLLDGTMNPELRLLSTAAGRANLQVLTVGSGAEALTRALDLLIQADAARLKAATPKTATPKPPVQQVPAQKGPTQEPGHPNSPSP